jgi:thiosulfate/3-mercaptopyruvate sulfurtransferase
MMLRTLAAVAAWLFSFHAWAAQPLLSAEELAPLLDNPRVRIVDIRDAASYANLHIPGAVSAPYGGWRGPSTNPGELPPVAKLEAQVQRLGLSPETHVVVVSSGVDATDFGASARVYWTLKYVGLGELSVLNGGMKAWTGAGLPQNNAAVAVTPSGYVPRLDNTLLASRDELASLVGSGKATLVDARPSAFYRGETRHQAATVPGTVKGAVNVEHATWFKPGSSVFIPADDARTLAAGKALDPDRETVSFCNTGHWAATNWFALSEVLGQKNVKLYAGSMVDWTQAAEPLPMDNVPNRAEQLMIDLRLWSDRTFK